SDGPVGPVLAEIETISSGFWTAIGRSNTALTKIKIAVFAPMPSASVSTATAVKPGFFSSWRKANLRSFITQSPLLDSTCICATALKAAAHFDFNLQWRSHERSLQCLVRTRNVM